MSSDSRFLHVAKDSQKFGIVVLVSESVMNKSERSKVAEAVSRLHSELYAKLNDAVIFLREAIPLLEEGRDKFDASTRQDSRKYSVPGVDGIRISKRTPEQLQEIYAQYLTQGLFENFLVNAVSQFESYLFQVLRLVIREQPKKLHQGIGGGDSKKDVSLDLLLRATSIEDVIEEVIKHRLLAVSYAKPREYLKYVERVAQIDTSLDAFEEYLEIKATRDIIIHNAGVANETYLEKAGDRKRADDGQRLSVDAVYFEGAISTLKRCTSAISADIDKGFPLKRSVKKRLLVRRK
jgi:hypothetical protein